MIDGSESIAEQQVLAKIISRCILNPEPSLLSKLLEVCRRRPVLASEFSDLFLGVQLDSVVADNARTAYEAYQRYHSEPESRETTQTPLAEIVLNCLEAVEEGRLGGWVRLNLEMTLNETRTAYQNREVLDLTALPGWVNADEPTRRRIITAAKKFVLEHAPTEYEWLVELPNDRWVIAGQRAWLLLLHECTNFVEQIALHVWERWGHVLIINRPLGGDDEIRARYSSLIELAHRKARVDIAEALYAKLNHYGREKGYAPIFHDIGDYWNEAFAKRLLNPSCGLLNERLINLIGE
jgi:hypothetical protein